MFQKQHRVVTSQCAGQQPFGVVGRRGNHDLQTRHLGKHSVVAARVMRGRRVTDADAAAQHDGHLEPAARHVLHFGDLVDDFGKAVENKVGEHEVDHRPSSGHRGAASQADEAAFADRRVAQPHWTVEIEKPFRGEEVPAALADSFPHHEDPFVALHLASECFERGLPVRYCTIAWLWWWRGRRLGLGVDVHDGGCCRRRRTCLGKLPGFANQFGYFTVDRVEPRGKFRFGGRSVVRWFEHRVAEPHESDSAASTGRLHLASGSQSPAFLRHAPECDRSCIRAASVPGRHEREQWLRRPHDGFRSRRCHRARKTEC